MLNGKPETTLEAIREVQKSFQVFKNGILESYPFLKRLPSIRNKKGELRFFVLLFYVLIIDSVISLTALLIEFILKNL